MVLLRRLPCLRAKFGLFLLLFALLHTMRMNQITEKVAQPPPLKTDTDEASFKRVKKILSLLHRWMPARLVRQLALILLHHWMLPTIHAWLAMKQWQYQPAHPHLSVRCLYSSFSRDTQIYQSVEANTRLKSITLTSLLNFCTNGKIMWNSKCHPKRKLIVGLLVNMPATFLKTV
jgi:hypothetical protein